MFACFDAGNSRLKWGLADAGGWRGQGWAEWSRLDRLAAQIHTWPALRENLWVSVAHPELEARLLALLAAVLPDVPLRRIHATAQAGGVTNGYSAPATLGADRWCALIGARALERRACLVVMAGTATTVDSLDAAGNFLGGMILPGIQMMKESLARGTARLPLADGAPAPFPRDTQSAIATGCLEAQAGAIERAFSRLPDAACCILSGGATPLLAPRLSLPLLQRPNLVLEGMRRIHQGSEDGIEDSKPIGILAALRSDASPS
ncbi:MAG: type III pantothenate kinase [Zoogloeaceae bacterium]|jgi:type III pantothenate kinase|nr:type III pantothenate kinase [Zoogloeaceae bacterium]